VTKGPLLLKGGKSRVDGVVSGFGWETKKYLSTICERYTEWFLGSKRDEASEAQWVVNDCNQQIFFIFKKGKQMEGGRESKSGTHIEREKK